MSAVKSVAALRRSIVAGTRIQILAHWNPAIKEMQRTVEKTQGNGYWFRHDGKRFWADWPKASEIAIHDDGSYTVRYGEKGTATFKVQT